MTNDAMARAVALTEEWKAQREASDYSTNLSARFGQASPDLVITMWQEGTNEKGKPLSPFETRALVERWCDLFGELPPDDDDAWEEPTDASDPGKLEELPRPDTMLSMRDVVRLTGLSKSTIKRMARKGSFPKPLRLSPKRIGWPAHEVNTWIELLEEQRRSPRQ